MTEIIGHQQLRQQRIAAGIMLAGSILGLLFAVRESPSSHRDRGTWRVAARVVSCRTVEFLRWRWHSLRSNYLVLIYVDTPPFEIRFRDPQKFVEPILDACRASGTAEFTVSPLDYSGGTTYWLRSMRVENAEVVSEAAMRKWDEENARWWPVVIGIFAVGSTFFGWCFVRLVRMTPETTHSATSEKSTRPVIGMLALATVLVVVSRVYRTPLPEEGQEILQQQGLPAAHRGMDLSREGKKLLPVEEQHEMDALYAEALQALTPEERRQLLTIARKGTAANDHEVTESAELIQKALRLLPQDKGARLWALVEKAVRLQLAQEKPSAPAGQQ